MDSFKGVGDWDKDGYPDFAFRNSATTWEVWSVKLQQRLLFVQHQTSCGGAVIHQCLAGNLDCTGDGLSDLAIVHCNGDLVLRDHFGATVYTVPTAQLGFRVTEIEAVGDLDNDGCDDFLVGGNEVITGVQRGVVALFSGRTGTIRHQHFGPQPYDILNSDLAPAGDVDGDGVADYAAGNAGGFSGLIMVWSGATGALLHEHRKPVGHLSGKFLAGIDVDLDGRPDVVSLTIYPNVPSPQSQWGRIRTLSSRDEQDLVHVVNAPVSTSQFTLGIADLGVQPGNPYPVIVHMDHLVGSLYPRIRAIRLAPAGTAMVGNGCSSQNQIPTIGLRRVDPVAPSTIDTSRIVLGSAPPTSLAACLVAPTAATSYAGVPLPIGLEPLGMPGCKLLVPATLVAWRITGSAGIDYGYAEVNVPKRLVATAGIAYAAQWLVLDPVRLDHAATPRAQFRVQ